MENFSKFGIEPFLLVAQIINFLILVFLLKRFLYKPILTVLKKREQKIKEGLAAAAKGEAMMVKAREEEKIILEKANEETKLLAQEAKQRAIELREGMLEDARKESEIMRQRAMEEVEDEKSKIEKELERKTITTALRVLEHVLPKVLTREDQIRILENSQQMLRKALSV